MNRGWSPGGLVPQKTDFWVMAHHIVTIYRDNPNRQREAIYNMTIYNMTWRDEESRKPVEERTAYRNLTILAKKEQWPDGILEQAQQLAIKNPDYFVTYAYGMLSPAKSEGLSKTGFYGQYTAYTPHKPRWIYAPTEVRMQAEIENNRTWLQSPLNGYSQL
jgi:hypothetical protein